MTTQVQKRLVIVGATGMVGGYGLRYALDHPGVGGVTAIGRKPTGIVHPKLKEVTHQDFADCSALAGALSGQDAAIFCPGTYTGVVPDAELRRITVDYTVEFARVLRDSAERHGFEYYRHGTLSLFAALNTQTGEVVGQTVPHHTSAAFVDFLSAVVAGAPRAKTIHVILDNLATHKTQAVRSFLIDHPKVRLHFTPTSSSWLNQVELWFAKIERDLLARGIFTSVPDLARRIRTYIRHHNTAPKPIRWTIEIPRIELVVLRPIQSTSTVPPWIA
jgi:transposase